MWQQHLIQPNHKLQLARVATDVPKNVSLHKSDAEDRLDQLRAQLLACQELLYAESKHKVLIVLQAMDTGGKDSTIRLVFNGVNPQGVEVVRFQAPTADELAHDFLWRVHRRTPAKGMITVFNRSHYEDVVTVGVHGLVNPAVIRKRYEHINGFERLLVDEGTVVLKFFLHISKVEQRQRLQDRLDDPKKHWKFNLGDLHERKSWTKYMQFYQEAMRQTSSPWAPWCVVPSDKKWYRDLVVMECIVDHLKNLRMRYPKLTVNPKTVFFK